MHEKMKASSSLLKATHLISGRAGIWTQKYVIPEPSPSIQVCIQYWLHMGLWSQGSPKIKYKWMSTTSLKISLNNCMSHDLFYVQIHKLRPWHVKNVRIANFLRNKRILGNTTLKLDWTLKDTESTPQQSSPKYMITSSPLLNHSLLVHIFSRTWASSPNTLIKKDSLLFSGPLKIFPLNIPYPSSLSKRLNPTPSSIYCFAEH